MPIRLLSSAILFFLVACTNPHTRESLPKDLHDIPAGTTLSLEKTLHFAKGSLRVFFQDGEPHAGQGLTLLQGINRYRPHCVLELRTAPQDGQTLSPRTFNMERVKREVTYEDIDISIFSTVWMLSGGEPKPHSFACFKAGNAAYEKPLTLREIDRVVGSYFQLMAPPEE